MANVYDFQKRIELYHLDGAGVIYYGQLFYFIHDAFAQFLRDHQVGIQARLKKQDYVFPVVHAEANYSKFIQLDDLVNIEQTVGAIGEKAFKMKYKLWVENTQVADATIIHAMIDPKTKSTIEIPKNFQAVLEPFLEKG